MPVVNGGHEIGPRHVVSSVWPLPCATKSVMRAGTQPVNEVLCGADDDMLSAREVPAHGVTPARWRRRIGLAGENQRRHRQRRWLCAIDGRHVVAQPRGARLAPPTDFCLPIHELRTASVASAS